MFEVVLPHDWWRPPAVAASAVSLVSCVLVWNVTLVVGPVVAVGVIVMLGIVHWPTEAALGY